MKIEVKSVSDVFCVQLGINFLV